LEVRKRSAPGKTHLVRRKTAVFQGISAITGLTKDRYDENIAPNSHREKELARKNDHKQ